MSIFRLSSFKIEIPIVGIFIWIVNYSKIAAVINLALLFADDLDYQDRC